MTNSAPCKHGDPCCPCQDGDPCHYEGENPMSAPKCEECGHLVSMHLTGTGCTYGHTNQYCACQRGGRLVDDGSEYAAQNIARDIMDRDDGKLEIRLGYKHPDFWKSRCVPQEAVPSKETPVSSAYFFDISGEFQECPCHHNTCQTPGRRKFWVFVHNLIAHPLMAISGESRWSERFHEWTAGRM